MTEEERKLLEEIEAKAQAATLGAWNHCPVLGQDGIELIRDEVRCGKSQVLIEDVSFPSDAKHIARMDPPTTLKLVEWIRRLEAEKSRREAFDAVMAFGEEQMEAEDVLKGARW